jgi:hypothetical protein
LPWISTTDSCDFAIRYYDDGTSQRDTAKFGFGGAVSHAQAQPRQFRTQVNRNARTLLLIQASVSSHDKPLPVSSSTPPVFAEQQISLFREVLTLLNARQVPYVVSGAFALTSKTVVVVHYAPIGATVKGENPEIYPYLGSSRLGEVIDRHGADLVLHGHAHHGTPDGQTPAGIPVHNVALHPNLQQNPPKPYRIFEV